METTASAIAGENEQMSDRDEGEDNEDTSLRASLDNQHWVEKLFPPAFGFTVDELLADIGKKDEEPEMTAFEKYANRESPLDTSAIKNVYERVWLIQSLQREEMQRAESQQGEGTEGTLRRSFTVTLGSQTKELRHADTSTVDLEASIRQEREDACIWSSSEIGVLREVFQTARIQNQQLKARVAGITERYDKMNAKYKQQRMSLEGTTRQLNEAIKSNNRLHILSQNLNSQLKTANDKIDFLRAQVESFKQDREAFQQQAHESKLRLEKERLERQSAQIELDRQSKEAVRNRMVHEEKFKASHEQELNKLRKRIRDLESDLDTERKDHSRSKRGLDHLRAHFASLPYSGDVSETNMVVEDQLKKWSI